jgi:hypothetical protein
VSDGERGKGKSERIDMSNQESKREGSVAIATIIASSPETGSELSALLKAAAGLKEGSCRKYCA